MNRPSLGLAILITFVLVAMLSVSCTPTPMPQPAVTPDVVKLETQVAQKLGATLTAKAPTVTTTPSPAPTTRVPTPKAQTTPTAEPITSTGPLLAYAAVGKDDAANLVLYDTASKRNLVLTHFTEDMNMSDISWSSDGKWLLFVSAHDFIHSRSNERNLYMMRVDGTDLRMISGNYVDPSKVVGPFQTIKGNVANGMGACLVCAQGAANLAPVAADGTFELAGVPTSASWVRAVCQDGAATLQGDRDLVGTEITTSVTITVETKGSGWLQASFSRNNLSIVGTRYTWTLDKDGKRQYALEGVIIDLQGSVVAKLDIPAGATLAGVDWSPKEDKIIGALDGEKSTWLWQWDIQGKSLGALVEIANTDQEALSASNPVWSSDGTQVAYALGHSYLWGEDKSRTEIMIVPATGKDPRTLVKTDWGNDAQYPSFSADGGRVFYQLTLTGKGGDSFTPVVGDYLVHRYPGRCCCCVLDRREQ